MKISIDDVVCGSGADAGKTVDKVSGSDLLDCALMSAARSAAKLRALGDVYKFVELLKYRFEHAGGAYTVVVTIVLHVKMDGIDITRESSQRCGFYPFNLGDEKHDYPSAEVQSRVFQILSDISQESIQFGSKLSVAITVGTRGNCLSTAFRDHQAVIS